MMYFSMHHIQMSIVNDSEIELINENLLVSVEPKASM